VGAVAGTGNVVTDQPASFMGTAAAAALLTLFALAFFSRAAAARAARAAALFARKAPAPPRAGAGGPRAGAGGRGALRLQERSKANPLRVGKPLRAGRA